MAPLPNWGARLRGIGSTAWLGLIAYLTPLIARLRRPRSSVAVAVALGSQSAVSEVMGLNAAFGLRVEISHGSQRGTERLRWEVRREVSRNREKEWYIKHHRIKPDIT